LGPHLKKTSIIVGEKVDPNLSFDGRLLGVRWLAYLLTSSDNALKELSLGGGNGSDVFIYL